MDEKRAPMSDATELKTTFQGEIKAIDLSITTLIGSLHRVIIRFGCITLG